MSNRRSTAANAIRGPQSALTDFLASHNISAQQISSDYQRRLREAQEREAQESGATNGDAPDADNKENELDSNDEDAAERKKRKRKEEKAIMKIKQSKEFKRRKSQHKPDYSDDEDDDAIARQMLAKAQPLPGQLENCDICEKRFTVTPYSRTGPDGGLLCTKCGKELKDEENKAKTQDKKKGPVKGRKRQTESDRMMGDVRPGAKSLLDACVRRVADVVHDIEEFGDMPQNLLDRLSQILSKKRVLTPRTLELFLQPGADKISIYDCGKLEEDDFHKIFSFMPDVMNVNLRFAGQMKDAQLLYMVEKNKKIKHLQLGATNLISDAAWVQLFQEQAPVLESLKISELNDSLSDESVAVFAAHGKNLRRLKLRQCSHMGEPSIYLIAELSNLEHLSLAVAQDSSVEALVTLITNLGFNLRTLSLEDYVEADDSVIEAIQKNCSKLTKIRFTGNSLCSDRAFANLFKQWSNPPIPFIDLSNNRDIDAAKPDGPENEPIGFGSEAFKALMKHSGALLQRLNLHSCRHISKEALMSVFDGKRQYPSLREIDLSFVSSMDDVVMTGIFRSCPQLSKLTVFACFNARAVRVPAGIAVIGLPNAQDKIVIEGNAMEL